MTTVTPVENALREKGKTQREQWEISLQDCKKVSPYFFYPYIGKDNRVDQIESKKQMWINS